MADIAIFRINYKSDFILTLNSDAGWLTPFCIKFWTGAPSQAYYAYYDGMSYTHCAPVEGEPTKLLVQFDDHHLPIGDLKFQIGYHFTVADFPTSVEDEVINQASVIIEVDDVPAQVMLDLNGETAPEIEFSLPAYANEAQRIANEQARIAAEQQRIANEDARIQAEETRQYNEQQRIQHEEERVSEFARLKSESEAATTAANAAATLANEKAQLADDKATLAQAAATLANEKAQLAADKAALAQAAATLANEKAALAQQKATYAQTQGDYAKEQGDYAKAQGDTAQADHVRAEADHTTAADDHSRAEGDHTTAASDHSLAESDHTTAASDHSRAESDHTTAASDHSRAESDHTTSASDHTRAEADHTTAASDHETAASDHTRAESDHAAVEVYVDSLGAFDISSYHATGGELAKYADLTAALGTDGANIPESLRKGGMSVKFVQSSDNKYVQCRLISESFKTNAAYWVNIEEEVLEIESNFTWVRKVIPASGGVPKGDVKRLSIDGGINVTKGGVVHFICNGQKFAYHLYDELGNHYAAQTTWQTNDLNLIIPKNGKIGIVIAKQNDLAAITPEERTLDVVYSYSIDNDIDNIKESLNGVEQSINSINHGEIAYNDSNYELNKRISSDNTVSSADGFNLTEFISVPANTNLLVYRSDSSTNPGYVCKYNADRQFLGYVNCPAAAIFETGETVAFIRFDFPNSYSPKVVNKNNVSQIIWQSITDYNSVNLYTQKELLADTKNKADNCNEELTNFLQNGDWIDKKKNYIEGKKFRVSGSTVIVTNDDTCGISDKIDVTGISDAILSVYRDSNVAGIMVACDESDKIIQYWNITTYRRITDLSASAKYVLLDFKLEREQGTENPKVCNSDYITIWQREENVERHLALKDIHANRWNDISLTTNPLDNISVENRGAGIIKTWGFIGDSLSSGYFSTSQGYTRYDYSWPQRMCRMLGVEGINYSKGGLTAKAWCNSFGKGTEYGYDKNSTTPNTPCQSLFPSDPHQAYVVALGVNDYNVSHISVGDVDTDIDMSDYHNNADTYAGWMGQIVQRIKVVNPNAIIFMVTTPCDAQLNMFEYNAVVRDLAEKFTNVLVIDLERYSTSFSDGLFKLLYLYGPHMSAIGYEYAVIMMMTYIDWLIRKNPTMFQAPISLPT